MSKCTLKPGRPGVHPPLTLMKPRVTFVHIPVLDSAVFSKRSSSTSIASGPTVTSVASESKPIFVGDSARPACEPSIHSSTPLSGLVVRTATFDHALISTLPWVVNSLPPSSTDSVTLGPLIVSLMPAVLLWFVHSVPPPVSRPNTHMLAVY